MQPNPAKKLEKDTKLPEIDINDNGTLKAAAQKHPEILLMNGATDAQNFSKRWFLVGLGLLILVSVLGAMSLIMLSKASSKQTEIQSTSATSASAR